jgi:hypothetical protein
MFPGYHQLVRVSDCELSTESTVNCVIRITYPRDPYVSTALLDLDG